MRVDSDCCFDSIRITTPTVTLAIKSASTLDLDISGSNVPTAVRFPRSVAAVPSEMSDHRALLRCWGFPGKGGTGVSSGHYQGRS